MDRRSNRGGNNSGFSYRPNSGRNNHTPYGRGGYSRNRTPYDNRSSASHYGRNQHPTYNNYTEQSIGRDYSTDEQKINDDDRTHYAVNLLLKPVEMGISTRTQQGNKEFKGLCAFNHYFGLLAPSRGLGYTIPDVWDGYFHITIAKFITQLPPDEVDEVFRSFTPDQEIPSIPEIVFRASKIRKVPGTGRPKGREHIPFIILPIDLDSTIRSFHEKIQPLLKRIEQRAQAVKWSTTEVDKLHVTIRKYSDISFDSNQIHMEQFPVEFRCSQLEIKQTREQAKDRFKKRKQMTNIHVPWWCGVTESDGKCSGCGTRIISEEWEGFCIACEKYEVLIPLWSTTGTTHLSDQVCIQSRIDVD